MEAILVIDMQQSVFTSPRFDSEGAIRRINQPPRIATQSSFL